MMIYFLKVLNMQFCCKGGASAGEMAQAQFLLLHNPVWAARGFIGGRWIFCGQSGFFCRFRGGFRL
ncbi:hypothetical protein [Serratia ficaria]|uniref:hypothetical protein n=1 Tax=Serratia ficaria TaxID=61651 RepID=UPI000A76E3B5|nr:hypothetical protein [Serratia ficaria]